jgi:hypothetical protein
MKVCSHLIRHPTPLIISDADTASSRLTFAILYIYLFPECTTVHTVVCGAIFGVIMESKLSVNGHGGMVCAPNYTDVKTPYIVHNLEMVMSAKKELSLLLKV